MTVTVRLATLHDANEIAELSQRAVEHGLPWCWTPPRVMEAVSDANTNVVVATLSRAVIGFGIMEYEQESAHLLLFAVDEPDRRQGLGTRLLIWLERVAIAAGITLLRVEARRNNAAAIAFYIGNGFAEQKEVLGMYFGCEDGVRLTKRL